MLRQDGRDASGCESLGSVFIQATHPGVLGIPYLRTCRFMQTRL